MAPATVNRTKAISSGSKPRRATLVATNVPPKATVMTASAA